MLFPFPYNPSLNSLNHLGCDPCGKTSLFGEKIPISALVGWGETVPTSADEFLHCQPKNYSNNMADPPKQRETHTFFWGEGSNVGSYLDSLVQSMGPANISSRFSGPNKAPEASHSLLGNCLCHQAIRNTTLVAGSGLRKNGCILNGSQDVDIFLLMWKWQYLTSVAKRTVMDVRSWSRSRVVVAGDKKFYREMISSGGTFLLKLLPQARPGNTGIRGLTLVQSAVYHRIQSS